MRAVEARDVVQARAYFEEASTLAAALDDPRVTAMYATLVRPLLRWNVILTKRTRSKGRHSHFTGSSGTLGRASSWIGAWE